MTAAYERSMEFYDRWLSLATLKDTSDPFLEQVYRYKLKSMKRRLALLRGRIRMQKLSKSQAQLIQRNVRKYLKSFGISWKELAKSG